MPPSTPHLLSYVACSVLASCSDNSSLIVRMLPVEMEALHHGLQGREALSVASGRSPKTDTHT